MRWLSILLFSSLLWSQAPTWDRHAYGNHRYVLTVPAGDAVRIHLPWRLRTPGMEQRQLWVVDAVSGRPLKDVARRLVNRERCELVLRPEQAGTVYLYPLPYAPAKPSSYPDARPLLWKDTADATWMNRHPSTEDARLPLATLVGYQAISPYHAFTEMEHIATASELSDLHRLQPERGFLVFPEDREHPIRMALDVPERWSKGPQPFHGTAQQEETFAFQLGLWARRDIQDLTLTFSAAQGPGVIPASAFQCVNVEGTQYQGQPFQAAIHVAPGHIQPLWCLLNVPPQTSPGEYQGWVELRARGELPQRIPLAFTIRPGLLPRHGDDEPWRLSRLRWLNEQRGTEPTVIPPFLPIHVRGPEIQILGRIVTLGAMGLPSRVQSTFTPELTGTDAAAEDLLAAPIVFEAVDDRGAVMAFEEHHSITRISDAEARLEAHAKHGPIDIITNGTLSFEGAMELDLAITAREATALKDLRLVVPLRKELATHMMGLGHEGGKRPASLDWHWDVANKNQDALWIGSPHAGVQLSLRDDHYVRPLNTNFYTQRPLVLPDSWGNGGKGGIRMEADAHTTRIMAYGGPRQMEKGQTLHFQVRLLFTPFKPIDPPRHFRSRFFHAFKPIEDVRAAGANIINVHHDTAINPYINYPFLRPEAMRAYAQAAHQAGMTFKIYDTVRELTTRAPELWALRSLGSEVLAHGPGRGSDWCVEHLDPDFLGGWFASSEEDSSLVTLGMSRWHNFYVSGLAWLADHVGIDGLYLDDVAFDRSVMLRVRRVLAASRPHPFIDLHSANQHNARDGFNNSALLYMELFPFLDRLWFGEYFDYTKDPDYWLVEVSGLPYGLMGEMLEGGGNPWRGMVFGMTARYPWEGKGDPRPLWKAWDGLGLPDMSFIGWWSPQVPVRTGRDDIKATVFRGKDRALIALASWAPQPVEIRLEIQAERLGLDLSRCTLRAIPIDGFQPERTFVPTDPIPMRPGEGWLLSLEVDHHSTR